MNVFGFDLELPLERAWTPPAEWYVEPEFFDLDLRRAIWANWQPVGRLEQVAAPGQYLTGDVCGRPFIVLRDEQGELRAFHNACRHHAAEVAQGCGELQQLVCPYHGWTYNLQGRLKTAPRLGAIEDFDKEQFGLAPLHVAVWGPWVWLHQGERPRDLHADLAPAARLLEPTGFDRLTFVERRSYELRCNWKVYVDNYLDGGYHVEAVHGGLAGQLDLDAYRLELYERCNAQLCPAAPEPADEPRGLDFSARIGRGAIYAWAYPNFAINRYGPIMDVNWILPLAIDRTLTVFDYYFEQTSGDAARVFIAQSLAASHQVQLEDIRVCESVQRGLTSGAYQRGRYAPAFEAGMLQFHRLLATDLQTASARGRGAVR